MGTWRAPRLSGCGTFLGAINPRKTRQHKAKQVRADQVEDIGISEEDGLRARFYALLSHLLRQPASEDTLANLRRLEGDDTAMGQALGVLAHSASIASIDDVEGEFTELFIGAGAGGEVTPYLSHYLSGALYEKPLAALRGDMERLGIAVARDLSEPEDSMAILCEMMHGLILGAFDNDGGLATQRAFFRAHVEPWAIQFFEDLEQADASVFYKPVGAIGRIFMGIEAEGFEMLAS